MDNIIRKLERIIDHILDLKDKEEAEKLTANIETLVFERKNTLKQIAERLDYVNSHKCPPTIDSDLETRQLINNLSALLK